MYKTVKQAKTSINHRYVSEGETIETKMQRVKNNGEPSTDGAPLIYTPRAEGVLPGYNIRTDRWDVALDAMDKINKSAIAKRNQAKVIDHPAKPNDGGAESTEGTK